MTDSLPPDAVSENQSKAKANHRSIPKHWIVLGLLVFAHAAFGVFCSYNLPPVDSIAFLMIGFLFSQPILFAIWAAFAPQRFYHRFLWSLLFITLISFSVLLGSLLNQRLSLEFFMIMEPTLFFAATLSLLLVRRLYRCHFIHSDADNVPSDYQANQFGIKHLLILTAITALAFGLFRTVYVISPQSFFPSVAEVAKLVCELIVLAFPITLIPCFTLVCHKNMMLTIFYAVIMLGINDTAAYFTFRSLEPLPNIIQLIVFVQLGAGLSVFISTLVIRMCGFRMIRIPRTASKALAS